MGTLVRSASGETFSFVATDDCTALTFSSDRGTFSRMATMGAVAGVGAHWYEVDLTPVELRAITGPGLTSLLWTAVGVEASSSDIVRVSMTNELDLDADGWTRSAGDVGICDRAPARNPGVAEICGNDVDEDCDGQADECGFDFEDPDAIVVGSVALEGSASTLAVADVDGDGVADLVNGAPQRDRPGHVYVSFGPLSGVTRTGDDVTITPESSDGLAESLAAGDADGDGVGDVLIGALDRTETSMVTLMLGPITGDVSTSVAELVLHRGPREEFSWDVEIAPDVTGDGGSDLVIGAPDTGAPDAAVGAFYVIGGRTTGTHNPEDVAIYTFRGTSEAPDVGTSAIALGDTDGDGIDDLATSGWEHVYVVSGGIAGGDYDVGSVSTATIELPSTAAPALAGLDHDGDGYGDLLVGAPLADFGDDVGVVRLFEGPLSGPVDAESDAVVTWTGDGVGNRVDAGDCNGDGAPDYLLATRFDAYLNLGPVTGVVDVASLPSLPAGDGRRTVVGGLLFAPDWSGDGVQEVVFGTRSADSGAGAAYVYYSDRFP